MSQVDILPEPSRRIGWGLAALVVAGLAAQGRTLVEGEEHIRRGYEDLAGSLADLGARIREVEDSPGKME